MLFTNRSAGAWMNVGKVVLFAILHFVPIKYAYPSRSKKYIWFHIAVSLAWFISGAFILYYYPVQFLALDIITVAVIFYFALVAAIDTWGKGSKGAD